MAISAKVIADSIYKDSRLTTMECEFPRFILAEFNTHRVFSRNSASSRAIPVTKLIERVKDDPFIPVKWGGNQAGMQAGEELPQDVAENCHYEWLCARDEAVTTAIELLNLGLHKQWANRILEPFMWHKVIVTSVEWDNFFNQRCSPLAQPEMEMLANCMRDALALSEPRELQFGDWHLPYVAGYDQDQDITPENGCAISAARCARVSYLTHDGKRDIDADLALYHRLTTAQPPHASPLEHPAMARGHMGKRNFGLHWMQLRQIEKM